MRVLTIAAVLAATAVPAHANLVLYGGNVHDSFFELGAQGFGNSPRALTLQTKDIETGSASPNAAGNPVAHGDAIDNGNNKIATPTMTQVGWGVGSDVGIGFNSDQQGQSGITMQALTLSIYNGTNSIASFSLAGPVDFSNDELRREPGNGNGIFRFVLDGPQSTAFSLLMQLPGSDNFRAGLGASLGCAVGAPASCQASDSGPDTFAFFHNSGGTPCFDCTPTPQAVPGPVVGAGLPGLLVGCLALFGLGRWRRNRMI